MSFGEAIKDWFDTTDRTVDNNKAVLEALPAEPTRGSYAWWARLARQNTGRSLCDSGGIYGYTYEQPVHPEDADPMTIELYNGKFSGASVSTIKWLSEILDAADEDAERLEKLLYWFGKEVYARESWNTILHTFQDDMGKLANLVEEIDDPPPLCGSNPELKLRKQAIYHHIVKPAIREMSYYDVPRLYRSGEYQNEIIRWGEFAKDIMDAFPMADALLFHKDHGLDIALGQGGNVYNHENDFTQVFQWLGVNDDSYPEFVIVETHNGCDVRGGYSDPVVATPEEMDYFWQWTADYHCQLCDEQWEMGYFYSEAVNKTEINVPVIDQTLVGRFQEQFKLVDQVKNGQAAFEGMEPTWVSEWDRDVAEAIVRIWGEQELDEEQEIHAVFEKDGKQYPLFGDDASGYNSYPASNIALWCPECGKYDVRPYHPVYGF